MSKTEHWFDKEAAADACAFFAELRHVRGDRAGERFVLEEWQRQVISDLFGWKRQNKTRQYREAYIEVPRKNGKSFWSAGIALYLLLCDGEQGANIYGAASTREQAALVFDDACAIVRACPVLSRACRIYNSPKRIVVESTNSKYFPLAAESGAAHGLNAHGIIFDELHVQPTRDLWDTLQTSRGARRQPLTIAITTAGHDRSSICWEKHEYAAAVLNGDIVDPTFYPVIYAADPEDDWTDESTWRKANPNYGVSIQPDFLIEECEKAKHSAAYENSFRRLYLNQWTQQEVRWLKVEEWDRGKEAIDWSDFHGELCYGGLDLSSTRDVTAFVLVFRRGDDYYVRPKLWIPEECNSPRTESDQRMLRNWATAGYVSETPGNEIEYAEIAAWIMQECERFDVAKIGFDPWHAPAFVQRMNELGFPPEKWTKFGQSVGNFAGPCRELERLMGGSALKHDGNPVMRWMIGNVAAKVDASGNVRPDKAKSADKIDGVVAMLMALGVSMTDGEGATIGESVCWVPEEA